MNDEHKEKLEYITETLKVKDYFSGKENLRKKDLMMIRDKLSRENTLLRDQIAQKRHQERLELLEKR